MYWLLYYLVGVAFKVGVRSFFQVQVDGLENYSEDPSTLVVTNHKRDLDSLLIATELFFKNGLLHPGKQISFMAAQNLFEPGFLGTWLQGPKILQKLLSSVSLGKVLTELKTYPISHLNFRSIPIHEALQIILTQDGNHKLEEILREKTRKKILDDPPTQQATTIADFFELEGFPRDQISLRKFKPPYRKIIKQQKVESVKDQLSKFIDVLDEGGVLYITPEGQLSSDGRIGRLKDSLLILLEETNNEVTLTPTNVTYDFLTDSKRTVFVTIGEEMRGLSKLERKARSKQIRRAMVKLTKITMSQLGSRQLVKVIRETDNYISKKRLRERVYEDFQTINNQELNLDKSLTDPANRNKRWKQFLKYCKKRDIIKETRKQRLKVDPELGAAQNSNDRLGLSRKIGYKIDPVRYCSNELLSLEKLGILDLN